jgi:hypothetical protein
MDKHLTVVGVLRIGYGIAGFMTACLVLLFTIGPGMLAQCCSDDGEALAILTMIGGTVAMFIVLYSALSIIGGIWVMKRKNWARYLSLILSVLDIFNFPFGTALGIYCIWALAHDETARIFTKGASSEAVS